MSSSVSEVHGDRGDEDGVELVNVRVVPAYDIKADDTTDEGFDTQDITASLVVVVDTPGQQTSIDLKQSPQVNQCCLPSRHLCVANAFYYKPANAAWSHRICLCAGLSVCLYAPTFKNFDLESYFLCADTSLGSSGQFRIARSSGQGQGHMSETARVCVCSRVMCY